LVEEDLLQELVGEGRIRRCGSGDPAHCRGHRVMWFGLFCTGHCTDVLGLPIRLLF
jgi:hypothetical protein